MMRQRGVTLIEVMITVAIVGMLLALALPNMTTWLNNSQIRTASDAVLAGLNLARSEALRQNATVRFNLTNSLDASCALSATGTNWVISRDDPTTKCDVVPSETTDPRIVQKKAGTEGTPRAEIAATGGTAVYFNGLGRLMVPTGVTNITAIDISNSAGGGCQHVLSSNPMRCLRITISSGGSFKLCDPAVTDATDPRHC